MDDSTSEHWAAALRIKYIGWTLATFLLYLRNWRSEAIIAIHFFVSFVHANNLAYISLFCEAVYFWPLYWPPDDPCIDPWPSTAGHLENLACIFVHYKWVPTHWPPPRFVPFFGSRKPSGPRTNWWKKKKLSIKNAVLVKGIGWGAQTEFFERKYIMKKKIQWNQI